MVEQRLLESLCPVWLGVRISTDCARALHLFGDFKSLFLARIGSLFRWTNPNESYRCRQRCVSELGGIAGIQRHCRARQADYGVIGQADTWENVPTDGSINPDHYLYGAPKQQP